MFRVLGFGLVFGALSFWLRVLGFGLGFWDLALGLGWWDLGFVVRFGA